MKHVIWSIERSRQTTASKEKLWKLWADVAHWNTWDSTVERSELYGDFCAGTKGAFKLVGGPKSKFVITDCKPFDSFTNTSYLPLCKVDSIISFVETQNGVLVTYRVEMTGFLTFIFSKVIGKKMAKGLSQGLEDLTTYAETSN